MKKTRFTGNGNLLEKKKGGKGRKGKGQKEVLI